MGIWAFTRFLRVWLIGLLLMGCAEKAKDTSASPPAVINASGVVSEVPFSPSLADWPHDISDLAPDPRVTYGRLENGLRYAVLPVQDKNEIVSIQLNIAAGYNQESENAYGVAHLLEHIAFRGKRGEDSSIIHYLQESGVGFGSDFNGFTQPDNTYYRLNLASGQRDSFDAALQNMRTLIDVPELTLENMEAEKRVVLAELKRGDTVQSRADQSYRAFSNPRQPRASVRGIGTIESLAAISLSDLETFKAAHYVPDQALLIIAGDVDPRAATTFIKENFADWKAGDYRTQDTSASKAESFETVAESLLFKAPKTKRQLNAVEHKAPTFRPDSFATRKRAFAQHRMTSMIEKRINRRIEDNSRISWINLVRERTADQNIDGVKLSARDLPLAMSIFEEERRRAVEFGFTSQELNYELAKRRAIYRRAAESMEASNAWREANRLRTQFTGGFVSQNARQELEIFDRIVGELTLEDYNLAARDVWTTFNPKYWSQSSGSMEKVLEAVKAARVKAQDTVLTPPEDKPEDGFQKAQFDKIGEVVSRDILRSEKAHRLLFENGVRLNYKASDKEADEIKISVSLRDTDSKNLLENYAAIAEKVTALSRADIEGTDAARMEQHFVGKRATFRAQIIEDRLVLLISTDPESLQENLEIISTFLVNFDRASKDYKKAFDKQIKKTKTATSQSPVTDGLWELTYAYSGQSEAYKSESINRPPIKYKVDENIEEILKTASVEVGVMGDFDPKALELSFASTLGAMPQRPDVIIGGLQGDESLALIDPGVTTLTYKGSAEQMALFYCWPENILNNASEYAKSGLLSSIFKNRLLEDLRNDLGVSYAPDILYRSNKAVPNLGFMCLFAQVDPKNEMKAHDVFQENIAKFQNETVTRSELNRARAPMLSQVKRFIASDPAYALYLSTAYSDPDAWSYQKSLSKAISAVGLKSLNEAAAETFDKSNLHIFRVQHYQSSRALKDNTLHVRSYLGDAEANFLLGKTLLYSPKADKIERGIELLNLAGEAGKKEAYIRLGRFYSGKYNFTNDDLKLAARAFESALPSVDASYRLGAIYFENYDVFPDVEDVRIIQLLSDSANGGNWEGQLLLAERMKDGTMTPRDEIGALKWALISNHKRRGKLAITDERGIARFITGLTDAQVEAAEKQAAAWVKENAE